MVRHRSLAGLAMLSLALFLGRAEATPSTNIWNPSTDIQAKGVWHFGIDNYFSVNRNRQVPFAAPTDVGITYGLPYGFEVGADVFEPTKHPLTFNAKWGLPEKKSRPAIAVGVFAVGVNRATQGNIFYGVLSKNVSDVGRFTAGGYYGRKAFLGGAEQGGAILAWDRSFGSKWWASVDYASGQNLNGALAFGGSYAFSKSCSVIVAYVIFNNHSLNPNDTITTQLDCNF
ncbi:MAG: hypothetical protein HYU66_23575 [Armatimonadetes bacterium]|nr:hypothetical protein [Armatimonadota bacterium]